MPRAISAEHLKPLGVVYSRRAEIALCLRELGFLWDEIRANLQATDAELVDLIEYAKHARIDRRLFP